MEFVLTNFIINWISTLVHNTHLMIVAECLKGARGHKCDLCVHCKYGNGSNWCQHDGNCSYGCVGGWSGNKCNGRYCVTITAALIYNNLLYDYMLLSIFKRMLLGV